MTMQIVLLTLLIFIAYILLYSALPFLFAFLFSGKDIYKKIKVFFLTFGMPIIFSIIILVETFSNNHFFDIILIAALIIGMTLRLIFANKKYLTHFNLGTQTVDIKYLTPFLKTKYIKLDTDDIGEFEIVKANWLVEYPASININYKKSWLTFELVDKKLRDNIKNQITAANKNICNSRGDGTHFSSSNSI